MKVQTSLLRIRGVQSFVLCGVLALGMFCGARPSQSQAQTQGFWVWNGKTMVRVYANDSSQYKVIEWQMWLYDQGKPTGGTDYWGLLRGASSQELMQKLKREQDTELSTNNYFGRGRVPSQTMTYFNPFGPVAIVERPQSTPTPKPAPGVKPTPKPATPLQPAPSKPPARWGDPDYHLGDDFLDDDLRKKRDAVRDAWNDILEGKGDLDNARNVINAILHDAGNPFSDVGGVLGEVIGTYLDAAYKLRQAQRMLDQMNNPALAGIDSALGGFWNDLDTIDASLNTARGKISAAPVGAPQPVAPLPATVTAPQRPNKFRPILGQRFVGNIRGIDSYEIYARFDIRNGNLEYVEEFGNYFQDGGTVVGDSTGNKRIVATIPLSQIDLQNTSALDDGGMALYTTQPIRFMWEQNEQNRQDISLRLPRNVAKGDKTVIEDFRRLIQEAKDGKSATPVAPVQPPQPRPATTHPQRGDCADEAAVSHRH